MGRKGRKRLTQKKGWKARKNEQYKENAQRAREAAAMSDPPAWSWGDFLLPEGSSPEHKTITEVPGEKEDSDGATAQEFLLIIGGKAYPYDPHENVDALASSLHTSHRAQVLHQLKAEIRSLLSEQDGIYLQASKDLKVLRLIFNYDADIPGLKFVLNVHFDGTLSLLVHTRPVPASHDFWAGLPKHVCTAEDVKTVVDKLLRMQVCPGNFDREFQGFVPEGVPLCDVTFESKAYKEGDMGATSSRGCRYRSTIRSVQCLLITASDGRCPHCALYRKTLWSMCRRASAREETTSQPQDFVSSHVPHVKMSRKQLYDKITQLKEQNRSLSTTLEKLRRDVFKEIREKGQVLGDMDNADLLSLLKVYKKEVEKAYPDETSLPRLFWEQQLKYSQLSSKTSMRWHPMIIRWCLYIRSRSATAYNAVRNMGFLALPSDRTLFDYSNILPSETGFVPAVARHLRKEAENLGMYSEPWRGFVGILQDEIHVCEGLVYDRNNGQLVGYVNLDETANELLAMANGQKKKRQKLASSMLVLMVRGATSGLRFPFAVFATTGITAEFLYPILWKAIQILEVTCGLKVLFITCDGFSANRRFFKLNAVPGHDLTYWCYNKYAFPKRKLYFISDVPHLLKTTRNCFANSGYHRKTRLLWKDGRDISWHSIVRLYEEHVENHVFSTAHKLTRSHVDLTAFSQMKVNLAAQILSNTVANSLEQNYGDNVSETVKFIRHMNRFFDCLNGRNLRERNSDLKEYRHEDDPRLTYLTDEFLRFFDEWEVSVMARNGFSQSEKKKMLLSHQTIAGLRITVHSIVEAVRFLLREGASFVLTHHFNQDPLEEHFAQIRQKGGANSNPTVWDARNASSKLAVIGSSVLAPVRGNVTKRKTVSAVDDTPLPKRVKRT